MKSDKNVTTTPAAAEIIDRGRGPEIKGTRITVYDVLDYVLPCWSPERIATMFKLTVPQVEAAIEYILEHKLEVLTDYVKILERCARGNPPEIQAKIDKNHAEFQELLKEVREIEHRAEGDVRNLIRQFRARIAKEHADARNHGGQ
jgi:uncharacterized protein (DUF433 family)